MEKILEWRYFKPTDRHRQITYLLFMKRMDELDNKQVENAEWAGDQFQSRFDGVWFPLEHRDKKEEDQKPFELDKSTFRWSHFTRMQAKEMLTHVQTKVFPFLKDLNGDEASFTHHMKNAVFIIPKLSLRDRDIRQKWPIPDTSSHYQAYGRAGTTKTW